MFRYALSVGVAATLLAGCGGSQAPIGVPGTVRQSGVQQSLSTPRDRSGSRIAPEAKSEDLLYVTSVPDLTILSYPQGKVVARISGSYGSSSICSNPNSGNVFVVNPSAIEEYAHGGTTPIATLSEPHGYSFLAGCAVDATTDNLAVATGFPGGVLIWLNAQGNPTWFGNRKFLYCLDPIYDSFGNLFLNANNTREQFRLAELQAGRTDFNIIDYPRGGGMDFAIYPPAMQWDGKYLAFQENEYSGRGNLLYQVQVTGHRSKIVNTNRLLRQSQNRSFVLNDGLLFGLYRRERNDSDYAVAVWKYPKSGKPFAHFYGVKNGHYANYPQLTLSIAPSR